MCTSPEPWRCPFPASHWAVEMCLGLGVGSLQVWREGVCLDTGFPEVPLEGR